MRLSLRIIIAMLTILTITTAACSKAESETVEDILSQAANVSLVKYDCVFTWPDRTQTSKVWIKDNMMRIEHTQQGQTIETYLCDYEEMTSFHWTSPENIPKRSVTPGEVGDFFSAMLMASIAADHNPRIIGTDTTDGKACYLVEYDINEISAQAWIWKEQNFLVRQDFIGAEYTTTIEFKNIEFGDILDSIFELPEIP